MLIEEKIRAFGQKRDNADLQKYLATISIDQLLELVETKLASSNFTYTWNYILLGFTDDLGSHKKRFTLVQKVIKEVENGNFPTSHSNSIIRRICMDLIKFRSDDLLKLCDFCVECIQSQKVSQMSWKELLPELVNVIAEKERVVYNDEEMTGEEFKHHLINSICMLQWFPSNVTSLTEIDMSLTKEEHQQVVNKLGKYLEKLTPQEIPSFVYQMLRLCKSNNSRVIFIKLQQYFGLRYANLNHDSNSDSSEMDMIENTSNQDISEAEGTVLLHINTSASLGEDCIRDYLTFLKNILRSPEFVLHPFQLNALLIISTIPHYEEKIFEILRSCVSRICHEEQKRKQSAWFRDMVPNTGPIENIFNQVINASAEDKDSIRDLILQGLINFGFVMLGVGSALGRDPVAEKMWALGCMVLFKIIKRKRHAASSVIEHLNNRIITEQSIECLYLLNKNFSLLMLENKSLIVSVMEGLVQMLASNAKQLLDAIIFLTKVSPTIRDHFILLLKKALYSKVSETRQVAVIGFLKLLTNLKVSNLAVLSQNSSSSFSSGHSLLTQISLTNTSQCVMPSAFSNEALCLEVLSILKRCFMQQAEVKIQLYSGLYNAVELNPELGIPVLEMIWMHFRDFYVLDEDQLPPLKFEKITVTKDVNVYLQEPLGNLIYSVSLIVTNVSKIESDNATVLRFTNILQSLCDRMIKCELVNLDLDDGTNLSDTVPEAQQKLLILKEAMAVYEALIGYKFHSWELESEDNGKEISQLFQGYCRLSHFLKNVGKPKKGDKKKKDANKTTQNVNTTIRKEGQKNIKSLKPPDTVLDFTIVSKILSLLHEPIVPWTTISQAGPIRSKAEFHQHIMQTVLNLVTSLKNKKIIEVQLAKITYERLCDISAIIYERIIKRLSDFIDFDCTTAVLAAESFLVILNVINNNFRSNFRSFLAKTGSLNTADELVSHLTEFIKTYQNWFDMDDEVSQDPEIKKMPLIVINTLSFLAHQIPTNNNALSLELLDWLKNYAVNNTISSRAVAQIFFNLWFDCHVKFKMSLSLFENVALHIGGITGVIDEEENDVEECKVINELTVNNAFTALCNSIKDVLEGCDSVIARLKADHSFVNYPESSDSRVEIIKKREVGVCCQLCFVVNILANLSKCTVPTGNLSEALLKNLASLYSTLTSLTKYFITRSTKINPVFQSARFEKVVKLAGKELSPVVYRFINYIEESQKQETEAAQKKKKNVDSSTLKSKVLKETRLIPKVVYEIEQLSKFVMQLSKKTNIDLSKLLGQGTVRDFRILQIKEVLEKADVSTTQTTQDSESEEDGENSPPPLKKRKQT